MKPQHRRSGKFARSVINWSSVTFSSSIFKCELLSYVISFVAAVPKLLTIINLKCACWRLYWCSMDKFERIQYGLANTNSLCIELKIHQSSGKTHFFSCSSSEGLAWNLQNRAYKLYRRFRFISKNLPYRDKHRHTNEGSHLPPISVILQH